MVLAVPNQVFCAEKVPDSQEKKKKLGIAETVVGPKIDNIIELIVKKIEVFLKSERSDELVNIGVERFKERIGKPIDIKITRMIAKNGVLIAGLIALSVSTFYGARLSWKSLERNLFKAKPFIIYDSKNIRLPSHQLIFPAVVENQLNALILTARNIHAQISAGKKIPYPMLLLSGPPGNGKTSFVKRLAQESGLRLICLSGSSFCQHNKSVQLLDDFMQWAKKQSDLIVFIDHADSLIAKRETMDPTSATYQLMNHLLSYLGDPTNQSMIVMATNHHQIIDFAVQHRINTVVSILLPSKEERAQILAMYRDMVFLDSQKNNRLLIHAAHECLSDKKIAQIASITHGFSRGEIENIITMLKMHADITDSGRVTSAIIDQVVNHALDKHAEFLIISTDCKNMSEKIA